MSEAAPIIIYKAHRPAVEYGFEKPRGIFIGYFATLEEIKAPYTPCDPPEFDATEIMKSSGFTSVAQMLKAMNR